MGWIANLQKLSSIFSPGLPLWWRVGERLSNFGWGAWLWALTHDYVVRTLQVSVVSHNIVDVPVLIWLSNDELGGCVALKLSVQIPVSGSTGEAMLCELHLQHFSHGFQLFWRVLERLPNLGWWALLCTHVRWLRLYCKHCTLQLCEFTTLIDGPGQQHWLYNLELRRLRRLKTRFKFWWCVALGPYLCIFMLCIAVILILIKAVFRMLHNGKDYRSTHPTSH